jgi:hypothetical protein
LLSQVLRALGTRSFCATMKRIAIASNSRGYKSLDNFSDREDT